MTSHPGGLTQPGRRPDWTLSGPLHHYEFRLAGPTLTCDCLDAGTARALTAGGETAAPPVHSYLAGAIVRAGRSREALSWQTHSSKQPDPYTRVIVLRAENCPLSAEVTLSTDPVTGMLGQRTTLLHRGDGGRVDVTATLSCWIAIHEPIEWMVSLSGRWAHETQVDRRPPGHETVRLESRAGKTGFRFQPYVALGADSATYVCQLLWSGNWLLEVRPREVGVVLSGGLNPWHFKHGLSPGDELTLPVALFGRFEGDLNHATQRLHDYRRRHRPDPERPIPVQFNSWYGHQGEPRAAEMAPLVTAAKRLGCEAFVLDAGWYAIDTGDPVPTEWQRRTGDWNVSRQRFPQGLQELSQLCRDNGLRFGLWFEPEVIGPLSAIRTEHPEWLHHIDGQPPAADQRAILNLGIPAARQRVFDRVTRLLSAASVGWMKWDFNADLGPGGWAPGLPEALSARDPLVAHYEGVYQLQQDIRTACPDLVLEMCASGGGRMDGAILSRAHVNWTSDQPGPLAKLAIHFGTQLAHPAVACNDWLVEWPAGAIPGYDDEDDPAHAALGDLAFRLRVAMLGSFGISATVAHWSEADFRTAAAHVDLYVQRLRAIIQSGDQYLLTEAPPATGDGDWATVWYVAKDGSAGVLFAFRLAGADGTRVFPLSGLRPAARYRARRLEDGTTEASGEELADGLSVAIPGKFGSALCLVELSP